jgi:hypothetical protein
MSRPLIDYTARRAPVGAEGFNPDTPIAGLYRLKLRSGAVWCAVRIWHGPPHDPVTGEEMDRSHRWQATLNGRPFDIERAWPRCADEPIDEAEHAYLIATERWAVENAPSSPQANPERRIDMLTAPPPF